MTKALGCLAVKRELKKQADPEKAKILARFFKTAKGEYGEGDVFAGVVVPKIRAVAKQYLHLPPDQVSLLLQSKVHEERMAALFILAGQYARGDEVQRERIAKFYLKHTKHINNWDLVDLSAPKILGAYLSGRPKDVLYRLAASKNLWERRVAVLSTFAFITHGQFSDTLKLSAMLLRDSHDLMHKAVGWMLREVGKRSKRAEVEFLDKHYRTMPRTMLRYAIEKFPEPERKKYLAK